MRFRLVMGFAIGALLTPYAVGCGDDDDGSGSDAGDVPVDAEGPDTGSSDAGSDAGSPLDSCDGLDDDMDGTTDEDAMCAPIPEGTSACIDGTCAIESCNPGLDDCNAVLSDGCEQDLVRAEGTCGGCATVCEPVEACVDGGCGVDGPLDWARTFGTDNLDRGIVTAIDPGGGVILAGITRSTIDVGGGVLPPAGSQGGFVASYAADGTHRWSRVLERVEVEDVAIDAAGNVYVGGDFQNTTDLGGGPLVSAGGVDAVVASFEPGGAHRWSHAFGTGGFQSARGIAVTPDGTCWVTGAFSGTVDFGSGPISADGLSDLFVLVYDTAGTLLHADGYGAPTGGESGDDVELDDAGNAFVVGGAGADADFGGGVLGTAGIFIASFTPDAEHRWSAPVGASFNSRVYAVAVDDAGNAYVAGKHTAGFVAESSVLISSYASDGTFRWSEMLGLADGSAAFGIAAARDIYVVGRIVETVDLGGGDRGGPGFSGAFVASYTADGVHRWSHTVNDAIYWRVAADDVTDVYVAGSFENVVDFGDGTNVTPAGSADVAFVKYLD